MRPALICISARSATRLLQQRVEMNEAQATQKKENVVAGIVGALLGSLIGVVAS